MPGGYQGSALDEWNEQQDAAKKEAAAARVAMARAETVAARAEKAVEKAVGARTAVVALCPRTHTGTACWSPCSRGNEN